MISILRVLIFLLPSSIASGPLQGEEPAMNPAGEGRIRVGVIDFSCLKKEDFGLSYLMYTFFLENLESHGEYEILSADSIREIIGREELCQAEDIGCLSEIGEKAGIDLFVTGTVSREGELVRADINTFSVRTRLFVKRVKRAFSPGDESTLIPLLLDALKEGAEKGGEISREGTEGEGPRPEDEPLDKGVEEGPPQPEVEEPPHAEGEAPSKGTGGGDSEQVVEEAPLKEEEVPESPLSETFMTVFPEEEEVFESVEVEEGGAPERGHEEEWRDLDLSRHEFWFFKRSKLSINEWHMRAKKRGKEVGLNFSGGYMTGDANIRYLSLLSFSEGFSSIEDEYTFESFEFSERGGGIRTGLSLYISPLFGFRLEGGIFTGSTEVKREWTIETTGEGNLNETGYESFSTLNYLIDSGVSFFLIPYGIVKPYLSSGLTLFILPPIEDVPPHEGRGRGMGAGITFEGGLFVDFYREFSLFLSIPFTYRFFDTVTYLNDRDAPFIDDSLKEDPGGGRDFYLSLLIGIQRRFPLKEKGD